MKKIIVALVMMMSSLAFAEDSKTNLSWWDGTFAYNTLTVNIDERTGIVDINLRGASIGVSQNMETEAQFWNQNDSVKILVRIDRCDLSKIDIKEISCEIGDSLGTVNWHENTEVTKQFRGVLQAATLKTTKQSATLEFTLPKSENINPLVEQQKYKVISLDDIKL